MTFTPELGARCRDTVSGWEGTATCRYEYMNGCIRWQIDGADEKGQPRSFVFDEQQIGRPIGSLPRENAMLQITPAGEKKLAKAERKAIRAARKALAGVRTGGSRDVEPVAR